MSRRPVPLAVLALVALACSRASEPPMPAEPVRTPAGGFGGKRAAATATATVAAVAPASAGAAASATPGGAGATAMASPGVASPVVTPAHAAPTPAASPGANPVPSGPSAPTPVGNQSPVAARPGPATDEAEVRSFVEDWRRSWQARDHARYLEHYAADFSGDGLSLAAWGAHKKRVFARAGDIRVELSDLRVELASGRATVRFTQEYRSGKLQDRGRKTLELRRGPGGWRIVGESFQALDGGAGQ